MECQQELQNVETELNQISDLFNERGLSRQYSLSCSEQLSKMDAQVKECLTKLQQTTDNELLLQHAMDIQTKVSTLIQAREAKVPINEFVRRTSYSSEFYQSDSKMDVTDDMRPPEQPHHILSEEQIEPGVHLTRLLSSSSDAAMESDESLTQCNSSLYCWGRSDFGALFHPDINPHEPNEPVIFNTKRTFIQIASNTYHSAAITTSGELYTCGSNDEGQAVHNNDSEQIIIRPKLIECLQNHRICAISCGAYHTVCVTASGVVISFGGNEVGQLGHSTGQFSHVPPKLIEGLTGKIVTDVACGELTTLLRTSAGEVFSCGVGASTGHPQGTNNVYKATRIAALINKSIKKISAGAHHSFALTTTGELYGWGANNYGQLGVDGEENAIQTPIRISLPLPIQLLSNNKADSNESNDNNGNGNNDDEVVGMSGGYSHSLLWTKRGVLYGCGLNKYGQLMDIPYPRVNVFMKLPLPDSYDVIQAACGTSHSVILCSSTTYGGQCVFTCGDNKYNQCGSNSTSSSGGRGGGSSIDVMMIQRQPIEIHSLHSKGILTIAAGGDQSFAIGAIGGNQNEITELLTRQYSVFASHQPCVLSCKDLLHMINITESNQLASILIDRILPIFASPTLLSGSFLSNTNTLLLDITGLEECYKSIVITGEKVITRLILNLQNLINEIESAKLDISLDILRIIFIIWQCPLNSNFNLSENIMNYIVKYLNSTAISNSNSNSLLNKMNLMLKSYPSHIFNARLLSSLQCHLSQSIQLNKQPCDVMLYCNAIGRLYLFNLDHKIISYEYFYNSAINNLSNQTLLVDYVNWRRKIESEKLISKSSANAYCFTTPTNGQNSEFFICNYSFLLSVQTKKKLLLADSSMQQQAAQQQAVAMGLMSGIICPFFILEVERQHMLQQTLYRLAHASDAELKKPLKVIFTGEEGIDEGGVRKEFFQLLTSQLFDIQFGMFMPVDENRSVWFNKDCTWSSEEFNVVGVLMALAVYNDVILDVHLPHVLYKKLLRHTLVLEDIASIDSELCKGLQQLLSYIPADEVENVFCRTFEISWDDLGVKRTYELKPNGANEAVTGSNREEYVDKFVQWYLNQSISSQFNDFYKGFSRVIQAGSLSLFRAEELELLVAGTPHLDFTQLELKTEYIGDENWNANSNTIKMFWKVLKSLDFNNQQKFLMFVSGSMKAPLGGLGELHMKIQRMGPDSNMLPTSHTCFNILLLPEYSSENQLEERLLKAIHECEGFGLK
eukprot:gene11292-23629_t